MSDAVAIAVLALIAGGLSLDTTAAFQVMVSQPLVAGAIAGLALGDVATGLVVGTTLQLVWLGVLPVGAAHFPDAAVGTVVGVGVAGLLSRGAGGGGGWPIAFGILAALGVGAVGQRVVLALRRVNVRFSDLARSRAEASDASGVAKAVVLGLALRFFCGAALAAAGLVILLPILRAVPLGGGSDVFPTALWAAPIAAAAFAARPRAGLERACLAAGFAVGMLVLRGW